MAFNKETGLYEGYIYKITNLINQKIYIGQTIRTVEERWQGHLSQARVNKSNQIISQAIRKYGPENFTVECLDKIFGQTKQELQEKLDDLERKRIVSEDSLVVNHKGYNIETGGITKRIVTNPIVVYNLLGKKLNEFDATAIAASYYNMDYKTICAICNGILNNYKGQLVFRWRDDPFDKYPYVNNNANFEYRYLEDDAEFDPSFYSRSPVDVYKKDTLELVSSFKSVKECCDELELAWSSVCKVCKGKMISTGGYIIRYKGDPIDKYNIVADRKTSYQHRKVNKYNLDGKYICTYDSPKEAGSCFDCYAYKRIVSCCNKKANTCCGFKWYFANDPEQPDKTKIVA